MILKTLTVGLMLVLYRGPGDPQQVVEIKKHIDDGTRVFVHKISDGGHSEMTVNIDDEAIILNPDDIELGESRTFALDDGRELIVSRNDDGLTMDLDGKTIAMSFGEGVHSHGENVWVGEHDGAAVHLQKMRHQFDGVMISGLHDLDEDTKERIISALRDAGVEKEVHFQSGSKNKMVWVSEDGNVHGSFGGDFIFQSSEGHGDHKIKFIKGGKGKVIIIDDKPHEEHDEEN